MNNNKNIDYHFKISGKELLFLLLLWVLVYFEPINIGPLKISQIWKTIAVIIFYFSLPIRRLPVFLWVGFLFAFKYLIYIYMPYGYLKALQETLESLIFPISLGYFYIKYKDKPNSSENLMNIAILLSLFVIYSTIPFVFGLKSLNPELDLESFGLDETAIKGLFYHIAPASKLFTVSTIVLINSYKRFNNSFLNKMIWGATVLLGTYFVYASWARTAWLIFIISLIISLFWDTSLKNKLAAVLATMFLFMGIVWFYQTNQAFRWRITGGATYRTDTELSVDELSSARLPFIIVAIDNLKEEGLAGQLFGYGTVHGTDLFKIKTDMAIGSHNRTFEILESSGLVALLLYIIFIFQLFKNVIRNSNHTTLEIRRLAYISIIMFFGFYFTSHGTPFWGEIVYACFFMAIIIDGQRAKVKIKYNG